MKFANFLLASLSFSLPLSALAGETYTLTVENTANQTAQSQPITLNAGDTGHLKFSFPTSSTGNSTLLRLAVTIGGKSYSIPTMRAKDTANVPALEVNPVEIAGPAVIKLESGGATSGALSGFATIEVKRAGVDGTPAAVPLESGTVWQVILEASTDLTNWTAVAPGDYPSGSPQRYFRTRLVKKP